MRIPFTQIAMEVVEVSAPELAIELDVSEAEAGWMLIKLIPWAIARCPDNLPPSASSLVKGPTAARHIARAVGFTGNPETFVDACERLRFPILERRPDGIRVRGLDLYDSYWGKCHPDLWKEWKQNRAGTVTEPEQVRVDSAPPDPDTDTETYKPLPVGAGSPAENPVVVGKEFWGPTDACRVAAGLAPEAPTAKWNAWCVRRKRAGFTPRDVAAAHVQFLRDDDFRRKRWPVAVFMSRGVYESRLRKLGPEPDKPPDPNDYARLEAAIASSQGASP